MDHPGSRDALDRMTSYSERTIAKSLLKVLESVATGDEIHESPAYLEVLNGLEGFIPEALEEIDQNWSETYVDGVLPFVACKIGERTIKIFGQCFTLPSRSNSTMYVRMQVDPAAEKVNWFECKLGLETHRNGQTRDRNHRERMAVIYSPDGHEDSNEWTYMATYGTRDE